MEQTTPKIRRGQLSSRMISLTQKSPEAHMKAGPNDPRESKRIQDRRIIAGTSDGWRTASFEWRGINILICYLARPGVVERAARTNKVQSPSDLPGLSSFSLPSGTRCTHLYPIARALRPPTPLCQTNGTGSGHIAVETQRGEREARRSAHASPG